MVVFPLLLLLLSFHGILSDHGTEVRQVEMLDDEFFMDTNAENREKAFVKTLDGLLHGNNDEENEDPSPGHVVEHATDDEQLDLVMEVFPGGPFNKTGQLRYSSVPLLEDDLIHEILDVIYSRDEYVQLLNDPGFDEMYGAVQEMIRIPTQKVLKQQLFHKILASRAWYTKYFDPMLNDNKRQKLLDFGHHLLDAYQNGTLSTRDMLEYNEQLQNFAFFDREDDKEFRGMMEKLIVVFEKSTKIEDGEEEKSENPTIEMSTKTSPSSETFIKDETVSNKLRSRSPTTESTTVIPGAVTLEDRNTDDDTTTENQHTRSFNPNGLQEILTKNAVTEDPTVTEETTPFCTCYSPYDRPDVTDIEPRRTTPPPICTCYPPYDPTDTVRKNAVQSDPLSMVGNQKTTAAPAKETTTTWEDTDPTYDPKIFLRKNAITEDPNSMVGGQKTTPSPAKETTTSWEDTDPTYDPRIFLRKNAITGYATSMVGNQKTTPLPAKGTTVTRKDIDVPLDPTIFAIAMKKAVNRDPISVVGSQKTTPALTKETTTTWEDTDPTYDPRIFLRKSAITGSPNSMIGNQKTTPPPAKETTTTWEDTDPTYDPRIFLRKNADTTAPFDPTIFAMKKAVKLDPIPEVAGQKTTPLPAKGTTVTRKDIDVPLDPTIFAIAMKKAVNRDSISVVGSQKTTPAPVKETTTTWEDTDPTYDPRIFLRKNAITGYATSMIGNQKTTPPPAKETTTTWEDTDPTYDPRIFLRKNADTTAPLDPTIFATSMKKAVNRDPISVVGSPKTTPAPAKETTTTWEDTDPTYDPRIFLRKNADTTAPLDPTIFATSMKKAVNRDPISVVGSPKTTPAPAKETTTTWEDTDPTYDPRIFLRKNAHNEDPNPMVGNQKTTPIPAKETTTTWEDTDPTYDPRIFLRKNAITGGPTPMVGNQKTTPIPAKETTIARMDIDAPLDPTIFAMKKAVNRDPIPVVGSQKTTPPSAKETTTTWEDTDPTYDPRIFLRKNAVTGDPTPMVGSQKISPPPANDLTPYTPPRTPSTSITTTPPPPPGLSVPPVIYDKKSHQEVNGRENKPSDIRYIPPGTSPHPDDSTTTKNPVIQPGSIVNATAVGDQDGKRKFSADTDYDDYYY
ncbi:unnamed protein product [Caenorhabditis nigoni]